MSKQTITTKVIAELKRAKISKEDKLALLTAILDKISALPMQQTIISSNKGIIINGKVLSKEQTINLKTSVLALQDNKAHQLFKDQLKYLSINLGITKSVNIDDLFFAKAALYLIDEEDKLFAGLGISFKELDNN